MRVYYWTSRIFGVFVLLLLVMCVAYSQDPKDAPIGLRGYINSQLFGNSISGIDSRSDPFSYRLNGNLRVTSWGWKTNASFHISTSRRAYSVRLPDVKIPGYALVGVSPEYRWAKIHLGNRYMHFSDYSFSNHSFYGAGVELSPGIFRLSAFFGRLKRENASNIDLRQSLDPSFKRMGWGVKIGVEKNGNYAFIGLFKAVDEHIIAGQDLTDLNIYPQENAVSSITAGRKIGNKVKLEIDYAWSALSRNTDRKSVV